MSSNTIILAGGQVCKTPELESFLQTFPTDYIIAADSGLRHANMLGLTPHVIVGDFDSVCPQDLAHYATVPRQTHPPEKDFLDLELAIDRAKEQGSGRLVLLGATGGRLDQSLAALLLASRVYQEGLHISLHSGYQAVYPLQQGDTHRIHATKDTLFSVLCMDSQQAAIITVTGAKYNITKSALPFGVGRGVSNAVLENTEIEILQGCVLLIVEYYPDGFIPN